MSPQSVSSSALFKDQGPKNWQTSEASAVTGSARAGLDLNHITEVQADEKKELQGPLYMNSQPKKQLALKSHALLANSDRGHVSNFYNDATR